MKVRSQGSLRSLFQQSAGSINQEQILSSLFELVIMNQYQLQQGQLLASFRPDDGAPPKTMPPQHHQQFHPPQHHQPPHYYQHPPAHPHSQHSPPTQKYHQPSAPARGHSPPIVFNFQQQGHPHPHGYVERQSIVQAVGIPTRQTSNHGPPSQVHQTVTQQHYYQEGAQQGQPIRAPSNLSKQQHQMVYVQHQPIYHQGVTVTSNTHYNPQQGGPFQQEGYYHPQQIYVPPQQEVHYQQIHPQQHQKQQNIHHQQGQPQYKQNPQYQQHPTHVQHSPQHTQQIQQPTPHQHPQPPSQPQQSPQMQQSKHSQPAQISHSHPQQEILHPQQPSSEANVQGGLTQQEQEGYQQQYYPEGVPQEYQQDIDINQLSPEDRERYEQYQQQMQMQYQQGEFGQEYPPEYYQEGFAEITPEYVQELEGQATLWRQRFYYLYEKYENFYEKHDGLHKESVFLADQFLAVDSEEEWLALKQKYDTLTESMGELKEEHTLVLQEIQQNIQQNQKVENQAINQEASRVWQHRYHELLEQYQSLSHHYAELQSGSMANNDMDENERVAMMNEKYSRLEAEYNHVAQEYQEYQKHMEDQMEQVQQHYQQQYGENQEDNNRQQLEELKKFTQQLTTYIEQLENQNNNLMRGMKNSVEGSKQLTGESQIAQKLMEKQNEIKGLSQMVVNLEQKLRQNELTRPKSNVSKDVRTSQLQNQIQQMTLYVKEQEQKLSIKDYEINGLKDKIKYLEEQVHHKNQQIYNHNRYLQDKLTKIESDIALKGSQQQIPVSSPLQPQIPQTFPSSFTLDQDYESRMREYQRSIQNKNNEIRILEERIAQSQAETRKISMDRSSILRQWQQKIDQIEEEHRKKIMERDSKIRILEFESADKDSELQKKSAEKDNTIRALKAQVAELKEQIETKLVEKDQTIKALRDNNQKMTNELRDKAAILSKINSPAFTPGVRSPNQSFMMENFRHDEELKVQTQQLERKTEQINKLKKQRQSKNKQYKDLQIDFENLQEQNNKRRIEVNNLKRQLSAIQNLQLETDNLRSNLSKKNQQINQLKHSLYQMDRLKMELESARRQIEKQNQISRMKNRELEQLNDRNYELEEKIRHKDFRVSQKYEPSIQRNSPEELLSLQEENRRKQIEISRLKVENEELQRNIRKQTEELETFKFKYPSKLKLAEQNLQDTRHKLATVEKKYLIVQQRANQLEDTLRRLKISTQEELAGETDKIKQHYTKLVERIEEENRNAKEKIRAYEIKVHDLELENNSLAGINKELQTFKDENAKKIITLAQKLEEKDEEIKRTRQKGTTDVLKFRKKQNKIIEIEAALKSRDEQARDLERQKESLRIQLKNIKKQFEDYKHQMIEKMEYSTHKQMENLNKQLNLYEAKFALNNHNFDFKVKDKTANHVFERTVIYQLKEENDFLRRQLEGRGSNISLEKYRITQLQQEALLKSKQLTRDRHPAQDELQFYREKNKQLEERVNSHLSVNKALKERIDQLSEANNKLEGLQKLKIKLAELEKAYSYLNDKYNLVVEENDKMRNELNNSSPHESQFYDIQVKIEELQLKIDQVTLERNSYAQELRMIQHDKQATRMRIQQLESALIKSQNKCTILQSEIQRLKDMSLAQKPVNNDALLKQEIQELNIHIRQKENKIKQSHHKYAQLEHQCSQMQQYIQTLERQVSQLQTDQRNSSGQQAEIQKWRNMFNSLEGSVQSLNSKIIQLQGESEYYKSQAQRGGTNEDAYYFLEIIRSNYHQLEALASEVKIEDEENAGLIERIFENCRRGFESCQYIHQLLSN